MPSPFEQVEYLRTSRARAEGERKRLELFCRRTQAEQSTLSIWKIFDSSLSQGRYNFNETFRRVLPGGIALYLAHNFGVPRSDLTALELGGTGSRFFGGFPEGFFSSTVGVSLNDLRGSLVKAVDTERNHKVVACDIFNPLLPDILIAEAGMAEFSVIFERMTGGWIDVPKDPYFIFDHLNRAYQMLKRPGVMALQYPAHLRAVVPAWQEKANSIPGLRVLIDTTPVIESYLTMSITATESAPQDLPTLSPREVRKLYREYALQAAQTRAQSSIDRSV